MALAQKIAQNVVFIAFAKVLSTIIALVGIGFIARYLGIEGFGNYSIVIAFFAFFGSLADLGLYSITARNISRLGAKEDKIISNSLALRIISSLAVFILSPLIILFLPYTQEVKTGIIIAAAAFVFSSTYSVLNGIFQKNLAMHKVAIAELVGKSIQTGVVILAVTLQLGFLAIISSVLFAMAANLILVLILVKKYITLRLEFDLKYWKIFLANSLPMGISAFITFLYFKLDTILLSILQDSTQVGIYNAAYKVIENFTFFPAMIMGLILPIMSRYIFEEKNKFIKVSNETFKVFVILIVPIVIGALFLSEGVINLIAGEGFDQSADVLRILIFALMFIFFGQFTNNILIAANLQKKLMVVLFICAVFNISANLLLIPIFSFWGAASVSVMTEFLVVLFTFFLIKKHVKYTPSSQNILGIFIAAITMSAYLFFFSSLNFFFLVLTSPLVYFGIIWLSKTVTTEELATLISKEIKK